MAVVGDLLPIPESGWDRFDDTDENITYSSGWYHSSIDPAIAWNGTYSFSYTLCTAKFNFTGTRIRIIAIFNSTATTTISIDGESTQYYQSEPSGSPSYLCFEKTGLYEGSHFITISLLSTGYIRLDAFDVDSGCTLLPYQIPIVYGVGTSFSTSIAVVILTPIPVYLSASSNSILNCSSSATIIIPIQLSAIGQSSGTTICYSSPITVAVTPIVSSGSVSSSSSSNAIALVITPIIINASASAFGTSNAVSISYIVPIPASGNIECTSYVIGSAVFPLYVSGTISCATTTIANLTHRLILVSGNIKCKSTVIAVTSTLIWSAPWYDDHILVPPPGKSMNVDKNGDVYVAIYGIIKLSGQTGETLWAGGRTYFKSNGSVGYSGSGVSVLGAITDSKGNVYIAHDRFTEYPWDPNTAGIQRLDGESGKLIWNTVYSYTGFSSYLVGVPLCIDSDGNLLVLYSGAEYAVGKYGVIVKLNASSGSVMWTIRTEDFSSNVVQITATIFVQGKGVVVTYGEVDSYGFSTGITGIATLNTNGQILANRTYDDFWNISGYPAVDVFGNMYIGASSNAAGSIAVTGKNVIKLDTNGDEVWSRSDYTGVRSIAVDPRDFSIWIGTNANLKHISGSNGNTLFTDVAFLNNSHLYVDRIGDVFTCNTGLTYATPGIVHKIRYRFTTTILDFDYGFILGLNLGSPSSDATSVSLPSGDAIVLSTDFRNGFLMGIIASN